MPVCLDSLWLCSFVQRKSHRLLSSAPPALSLPRVVPKLKDHQKDHKHRAATVTGQNANDEPSRCPDSQAVVKGLPVLLDYAGRIHDAYFPDYEAFISHPHRIF